MIRLVKFLVGAVVILASFAVDILYPNHKARPAEEISGVPTVSQVINMLNAESKS